MFVCCARKVFLSLSLSLIFFIADLAVGIISFVHHGFFRSFVVVCCCCCCTVSNILFAFLLDFHKENESVYVYVFHFSSLVFGFFVATPSGLMYFQTKSLPLFFVASYYRKSRARANGREQISLLFLLVLIIKRNDQMKNKTNLLFKLYCS